MSSLNKVLLIGRLGKVESRTTQTGDVIVNASLATSYNNKKGEQVTEWHNLVFFRKVAEIADKFLNKGMQVYIEGQLKTEKYQAKDGSDRYTTKVIVDQLKMLGSKKDNENNAKEETKSQDYGKMSEGSFEDDDIPF